MRKGLVVLVFAVTLTASAAATPAHASTFLSLTNQSIVAADLTQTNRLDAGSPTTGCTGPPTGPPTSDGAAFHFDRYALSTRPTSRSA